MRDGRSVGALSLLSVLFVCLQPLSTNFVGARHLSSASPHRLPVRVTEEAQASGAYDDAPDSSAARTIFVTKLSPVSKVAAAMKVEAMKNQEVIVSCGLGGEAVYVAVKAVQLANEYLRKEGAGKAIRIQPVLIKDPSGSGERRMAFLGELVDDVDLSFLREACSGWRDQRRSRTGSGRQQKRPRPAEKFGYRSDAFDDDPYGDLAPEQSSARGRSGERNRPADGRWRKQSRPEASSSSWQKQPRPADYGDGAFDDDDDPYRDVAPEPPAASGRSSDRNSRLVGYS